MRQPGCVLAYGNSRSFDPYMVQDVHEEKQTQQQVLLGTPRLENRGPRFEVMCS